MYGSQSSIWEKKKKKMPATFERGDLQTAAFVFQAHDPFFLKMSETGTAGLILIQHKTQIYNLYLTNQT